MAEDRPRPVTIVTAAFRAQVSVRTIYRWVRSGRLDAYPHKIDGHTWVDLDDVYDAKLAATLANPATRTRPTTQG